MDKNLQEESIRITDEISKKIRESSDESKYFKKHIDKIKNTTSLQELFPNRSMTK